MWLFRVAREFHSSVEEVMSWPNPKFVRHVAFLLYEASEQRKANDKAAKDAAAKKPRRRR